MPKVQHKPYILSPAFFKHYKHIIFSKFFPLYLNITMARPVLVAVLKNRKQRHPAPAVHERLELFIIFILNIPK